MVSLSETEKEDDPFGIIDSYIQNLPIDRDFPAILHHKEKPISVMEHELDLNSVQLAIVKFTLEKVKENDLEFNLKLSKEKRTNDGNYFVVLND